MKKIFYFAQILLLCFAANNIAAAEEFPATFKHKFGTTTLNKKPERIVSLSFMNHDNFLALGVTPEGVRHWFGDFKYGMWPWAEKELGDKKPTVLKGELNIEQIVALKPDVIEAMWSGLTKEQYVLLSKIAPVVATLEGYEDYSMPWAEMALTTGKIIGEEPLAQKMVDEIKSKAEGIRKDHPEWQGATAVVAYNWGQGPGAYTSNDVRPKIMADLGFITPKAIDDGMGKENIFLSPVSIEDLSPLEADVLIWLGSLDNLKSISELALRKTMKTHIEGREIFAEPLLASALSHFSLLSLPFALDQLIPEIENAIDGDPKTKVTSAVKAKLAP